MSDKTNDNPFNLSPLKVEVTYDTTFKYIFAVPNETEGILTQLLNDLLCLFLGISQIFKANHSPISIQTLSPKPPMPCLISKHCDSFINDQVLKCLMIV